MENKKNMEYDRGSKSSIKYDYIILDLPLAARWEAAVQWFNMTRAYGE